MKSLLLLTFLIPRGLKPRPFPLCGIPLEKKLLNGIGRGWLWPLGHSALKKPQILALVSSIIFSLAGCASTQDAKQAGNLHKQINLFSTKLELAKRENLNLKRELTLFRKAQDVDAQKFITAVDAFGKDLSREIAAGDVWLRLTDIGLDVIVSAEKLFVSGSDTLTGEGKSFLDKLYDGIHAGFPTNYIYIQGHTDNQSLAVFEWQSDLNFSFARAVSVLEYFTEKKHMDPLRLSASGFGKYRPRAGNDTKEGRRLNRRIEIRISVQKLKSAQHS